MIFIGDIAITKDVNPKIINLPEAFKLNTVIANLEGAIVPNNTVTTKETKLFNDKNVVRFLENLNVKVVSLGNNHMSKFHILQSSEIASSRLLKNRFTP
jgi:hypothetical protein